MFFSGTVDGRERSVDLSVDVAAMRQLADNGGFGLLGSRAASG
jgi:hypothetical protein